MIRLTMNVVDLRRLPAGLPHGMLVVVRGYEKGSDPLLGAKVSNLAPTTGAVRWYDGVLDNNDVGGVSTSPHPVGCGSFV